MASRSALSQVLARMEPLLLQRGFYTSTAAAASKEGASPSSTPVVQKDWKAVQLPKQTLKDLPTTAFPGEAFVGDLRATSGLGIFDGKTTHTSKWLDVSELG
jgi:hypothetical protein